MKSVFSLVLIGAFVIPCFSYSEIPNPLDNAKRAVWEVQTSQDATVYTGTGFFVGENLFIAYLPALTQSPSVARVEEMFIVSSSSLSKTKQLFRNIVLLQEEENLALRVKRVLAVSSYYGLIYMETEENVDYYLAMIRREEMPKPNESLFALDRIGLGGSFQMLNRNRIGVIEEESYPGFYVNGTGIGPVLDERGYVVGVIYAGSENPADGISGVVYQSVLEGLISDGVGQQCSDFLNPEDCLLSDIINLKLEAGRN